MKVRARPYVAFWGGLAFGLGYMALYETTWWGWVIIWLACTLWAIAIR